MTGRRRSGFDDLLLGQARDEEVAALERAKRRAVRVVAARSTGVEDCRVLLSMLGLSGVAGLSVTDAPDLHSADTGGTGGPGE